MYSYCIHFKTVCHLFPCICVERFDYATHHRLSPSITIYPYALCSANDCVVYTIPTTSSYHPTTAWLNCATHAENLNNNPTMHTFPIQSQKPASPRSFNALMTDKTREMFNRFTPSTNTSNWWALALCPSIVSTTEDERRSSSSYGWWSLDALSVNSHNN